MPTEAVYGSWKSPLSSKLACDSAISIKRLYVDSHNPELLYWSELHPKQNGRTFVFSKNVNDISESPTQWTQDGYNAADTVHEYGGASYFVNNGIVYFMNVPDNKIYSQDKSTSKPTAITHGPENYYRYADGNFSKNPNFFFCIREDHCGDANEPKTEAVNTIVCVDIRTGDETVVAAGHDFYASPRVSPDGSKLCWMTWKHPNMPWDDTEIWVAEVFFAGDKVHIKHSKKVAGEKNVNYIEPQWTCDNKLTFIADNTGWWNLYQMDDLSKQEAKNICKKDEEIGQPCWEFGYRDYSPHPQNSDLIAVLYGGKPAILTVSTGGLSPINVEDMHICSCVFEPVHGNYLYMHAVSSVQPECILKYDLSTQKIDVFHKSADLAVDPCYLSKPTLITFPVGDSGANAYGYYYPPKNPDFEAPKNTLPPLLIKIHGGPTGAAFLGMDLGKQYFTSRGIAIFDVDYRGSTGYGTAFRKALKGKWGVYDIEDTCAAARYMADVRKEVDRNKLLSSGGSAGGYTTLADLTFENVFAAGASYYGVSDLGVLAAETHKFESRYCDTMIAQYPEELETYKERSPYYHLEKFNTPCAFFQGGIDQVVPPNQSETMFNAIKDKGIPCAYVLFPDEAHGFDKSENKQKALDGEFYFYSKMLGFEPADTGIEIDIENLPEKKN